MDVPVRNKIHIQELIHRSDELLTQALVENNGDQEKTRKACQQKLLQEIKDHEPDPLEKMVMLIALGFEEELPEELQDELIQRFQEYPHFATVGWVLSRKCDEVPMECLLVDFTINDFLESYAKRSISFEELVYRLAMLGRLPNEEYLRMNRKQRLSIPPNEVEMYHLW